MPRLDDPPNTQPVVPPPRRRTRHVSHALAAVASLAVLTLAIGVHLAATALIVIAAGHLALVGLVVGLMRVRQRAAKTRS